MRLGLGMELGLSNRRRRGGGEYAMDLVPGGVHAYGFKLAVGAWDQAIVRLRRTDGALSDFTELSLLGGGATTWAAGQDAFVHTIYDQLGGVDWVQSNSTLQPMLISSGTLLTSGGIPFAQFASLDNWVASSVTTFSGDFSVCTWFEYSAASETLVANITNNTNYCVWIRSASSFDFRTPVGGTTVITPGFTLTTGPKVHMMVVRASGVIRIYKDGTPPSLTGSDSNPIALDCFGVHQTNKRPFTGKFGATHMWGRALSPEEVILHYDATKPAV
jgi:hypothetical protein